MAIETNLNQSPYFDDFDENKNFHRVLFRPGYSVQARELTQMQSILQNQVERFAIEVVVDGTVITGVGVSTNTLEYVKLRDKDANNRVLLLGDFFTGSAIANVVVTGATSGMTAKLIDAKEGSEAAAPNYLSLFVNYTNSGSNNTTKTFTDDETLLVRHSGNSTFVVAANSISTSSTGLGFRATVSDGIVYHKGNFINVLPQSVVVEKYSTTPNKKIGFETTETIVDSNSDSSLLDNSTGSTNFAAPGANRLKLTPTLAVRSLSAANTTTFFSIAEIENGQIAQRFTDTTYSDIGSYISERSYETNGNFAIEPFNLRVREHLKNTNNLGRYDLAGGGDVNKLVCEVERGIGYVSGKRISIESSLFRNVDKATDWDTKDGRTIGQAFGNYIYAKEVVGTWDFQGLRQVALYDAGQKGISGKNLGVQGARGSSIGTARVRGFQWHSGTPGTASGQFRIYLFDVKMDSGKSFSQVRGVYENNGGSLNSMCDIVLESNGSAKLQEPGLNSLVFPFTQKGTKTLKDSSGNIDTQFVYRAEKLVSFATDGTATVSANTAHAGGTEVNNDTGVPLTNTDERNIIVVSKTAVSTAAHTGQVSAFTGNTITGSATTFTTQYQEGDFITITDGANTVTERIMTVTSDTSMQVANTFAYTRSAVGLAHKTTFPAGYIFDTSSNGTINSTSTQHQINLQQANLASTFTASVYFNRLRSDAVQTAKTVLKDKFIHINTNTHSATKNGPWSLGVADAYKLVAVYSGSNTNVSTSDNDVTSHFELDDGMKDAFYDVSYLKQKATSSLDLSSSGLMVKFNYFGRNTSSGIGYLSVDSYPIDDVIAANTTAITTQEIPLFTSPTNGKKYDLRDSVDFRPIKTNSITPSATGTVSSAPTNPAISSTFSIGSTGAHIPTPDENFQADIQYYLPRKDRVVLTKEGKVEVTKGVPSLTPRTPDELAGAMTLSILKVPVFPSLSPYVAKQYNRNDYQVSMDLENNRRYTMKDLRSVEQRVKNLEYYSSLNALESSAKNKQIFGSTGLDRFKNGFLVDNFDGHNIADTSKVGYRAAIDRNKSELRPTFNRTDVSFSKDLTLTSSNVTKTGDLITLAYTNTELHGQPYASKLRNPVQELSFNWKGEVTLNPSADNTGDTTTLPDIQMDFSGMYDAIAEIADRTGVTGTDWGNWNTSSTSSSTSQTGTWGGTWSGGTTQTTTTQTNQIRNGIQTTISPSTETFSIGNFVENVAVRDYIRARMIQFTGARLKPNTRVWPYFDDEAVTAYCTPANSSFANTASEGSILTTDASGNVYGVFRIPNDDTLKFRVGTRRFELKDISNTTTQADLLSTSAHGDYTSIGLDITQRGSNINMKVPQLSDNNVTDNRTLSSVSSQNITTWRRSPPPSDPLSQTFTIIAGESDGTFITKLDLYFGKKSGTYPITVQIREVENGFPTTTIVPYGSKTLQPSEVNANTTVATTATTFTFESPVFLKNNTDYAFTVMPAGNSDDYTLWVGGLGGKDVDTNELIHKQPASGIMFTSSDNKTWSPVQSEDVKYRLHKALFSASAGTVYVENDDIEYMSSDNFYGTFNHGEKVVAESVLRLQGITGNAAGDYVTVGTTIANTTGTAANGVVRSIVNEYANGTVIVKVDPYNPTKFGTMATGNNSVLILGSNFTNGKGKVDSFTANTNSGFVKFIDSTNGKIHLDSTTGAFANGYVRGQVSGAATRVTSVDNVPFNTVVPKIPQINYGNTISTWTTRTTSTSGIIGSSYTNLDTGVENDFLSGEKKVYSKTNEVGLTAVDGSKKSLVLKGTLSTSDTNVSPVIDNSRINGIVLGNVINNTNTDEHKEVGDASVRYITKPINLADGQDAEDLSVFLTSYKPQGTDIKVYAKIHNPEDSDVFADKDYTPLTQITTSNTYSDSVDNTDLKEFEFGFSANTNGQGFLTTANSHARLSSSNSEVVAYRSAGGSIYHTYKTFAIKIVMTSSGTNIVPLVKDMRAIALQK
jgi:hypothetical protein